MARRIPSVLDVGFREAQKAFFDRQAVIDQVDDARRPALSKAGAFVRRRSRSSIRKRKQISEPGQPPSSHVGTLKKFIFFSWDAGQQSVVVGPILAAGGGAEVLEKGGTTSFQPTARDNRGRRVKWGPRRTLRYRARPYMQPALEREAEAGTFADLWAGAVKPR